MSIFKNERQSKFKMSVSRGAASLFFMLVLITLSLVMDAKAQEDNAATRIMIVNAYGSEMGSIDDQGNVLNNSGALLGSVDNSGTIYNVSKINIGKTTSDGSVLNQSGTVLGSVNSNGEIFNVSGTKMGEVKGGSGMNRAGGAARLIFLK
jgi:hypothetical protein